MTPPRPPRPPVMELIARRRKKLGLSLRRAGEIAGMSDTRWRQLESGYRAFRGEMVAEPLNERALARMAQAVRLGPADLADAGYPDAAEMLAELDAELSADAAADAANAARAAAALDGVLTESQRAKLAELIVKDLRLLRDE